MVSRYRVLRQVAEEKKYLEAEIYLTYYDTSKYPCPGTKRFLWAIQIN